MQLQFALLNLDLDLGSFTWMMSSAMVPSQGLLTAPTAELEFMIVHLHRMQESYADQVTGHTTYAPAF